LFVAITVCSNHGHDGRLATATICDRNAFPQWASGGDLQPLATCKATRCDNGLLLDIIRSRDFHHPDALVARRNDIACSEYRSVMSAAVRAKLS
jgi:hypothetical protein